MQTKIWKQNLQELAEADWQLLNETLTRWKGDLREAAALIRMGELVAFPTETVYGLGADALNRAAIQKIFEVKQRPADNPLIIHVHNVENAKSLASSWSALAQRLASAYWPGPLTLVVPASSAIPKEVTAGLSTVAIRVPRSETALKLCEYSDRPIAAPSANLSGRPSPTSAAHVLEDLNGKIAGIIDERVACDIGLESTVLDVSGSKPVILRPGAITRERIERYLKIEVTVGDEDGKSEEPVGSPGIKYAHYAPRAEMYLVTGGWEEQIEQFKHALSCRDFPVLSLLCSKDTAMMLHDAIEVRAKRLVRPFVFELGLRRQMKSMGSQLYEGLHQCDAAGADLILAETYPETGFGAALMNRLRKAAGSKIWRGTFNDSQ